MAIDDREQQFERALARHLRDASGACPDAGVLAAYHERTLSLEEMAKWKEHVAACERCQEALALVEQTETVNNEEWKEQDLVGVAEAAAGPTMLRAGIDRRAEADPAPTVAVPSKIALPIRRPRANWKWIAPIGAIAAGVLVWIGSVEQQKRNQAAPTVEIAQNRRAEEPPPMALQGPASTTRTDQLTQEQKESREELRDGSEVRVVLPKTEAKGATPPSAPAMVAPRAVPEVRGQSDKKKDAIGEGSGNGMGPAPLPKAPPPVVASEMDAGKNEVAVVGQGAGISDGLMNAPVAGAKAAPTPTPEPSKERARSTTAYKAPSGLVAGNLSAITGTVLDPSGAAISGAVITATDTRSGGSWTAVADATGRFQLRDLPSDTYRLVVAQPGFAQSEQMVALQGKQSEHLNIQLKLGTSSQTVEVTAGAAAVNTSSAEVSKDEAVASELPTNGRNYNALMQLAAANPQYIVGPDRKAGWRVGDAGKIERTTDHGKTWNAQGSGVSVDLRTGSAPSGKVCWVVGKAGTILQTTDGGKHWKQITSPIAEDLGGVHAIDALHASIWDVPNRQSFETSDGGATWKRTANE